MLTKTLHYLCKKAFFGIDLSLKSTFYIVTFVIFNFSKLNTFFHLNNV